MSRFLDGFCALLRKLGLTGATVGLRNCITSEAPQSTGAYATVDRNGQLCEKRILVNSKGENIRMKNRELINILSEFPEDCDIRFMVFSELNMRRCDISDRDVMIRRNRHNGDVFVMLDTGRDWDGETRTDIIRMHESMRKSDSDGKIVISTNGDE